MSHQLIVAIGRESGSGGLDIAHALAERLQLPLFDKSILQKAAEDKGVSAETLESCCASTLTPENPSWYWAAALKRCWRTGKG